MIDTYLLQRYFGVILSQSVGVVLGAWLLLAVWHNVRAGKAHPKGTKWGYVPALVVPVGVWAVGMLFLTAILPALLPKATRTTFTSPEGKFSVSLPGTPADEPFMLPTPEGQVPGRMLTLDGGKFGVSYLMEYNDLPKAKQPRAPKDTLKAVVESMTRSAGQRPIVPQWITVQSYPGIQYGLREESGLGVVQVWVVLAKNRLYVLSAGPINPNGHDQNAEEFFGSFKITE